MIYFSESTLGFYDSRFNKNIPDDAKATTEAVRAEFVSSPPSDKKLGSSNGLPCWIDKEEAEIAQLAQSEMITELNWCDLQIKLHASSDKRAVSTIDDIYAYARACRDYVQNVDGELAIVGDKPVRPS